MSLVRRSGLNGLDSETDNTLETGAPVRTTDVPTGSHAARSVSLTGGDRVRWPWYRGDVILTKSGELYFGFQFQLIANNTDNDQIVVGIANGTTEAIAMSLQDSTGLLTIRIGGAVVATAVAGAITPGTWNRLLLHFDGRAAGDVISIYPSGDASLAAIITHTITGGEAATLAGIGLPTEMFAQSVSGSGDFKITDVAVMDPSDGIGRTDPAIFKRLTVGGAVVTGDGTPFNWAGSYADIDELPFDAVDFTQAAAVDLQAAMGRDPVAGTTDNLYDVSINVSAERRGSGTTAGTKIGVELDDGTQTELMFTPPNGSRSTYTVVFDEAPSGGNLSPAGVDVSTLSQFSRT